MEEILGDKPNASGLPIAPGDSGAGHARFYTDYVNIIADALKACGACTAKVHEKWSKFLVRGVPTYLDPEGGVSAGNAEVQDFKTVLNKVRRLVCSVRPSNKRCRALQGQTEKGFGDVVESYKQPSSKPAGPTAIKRVKVAVGATRQCADFHGIGCPHLAGMTILKQENVTVCYVGPAR
jgi:hypothetical protein